MELGGTTCFPSSKAPSQNIFAPDTWTYWYTLDETNVIHVRTTYYSEKSGILFAIPDSWAEYADVRVMSDNHFEIIDGNTEERIASVVTLSVDDNIFDYIVDGYSLVGTNGTIRYYLAIDASQEDETYIRDSFVVLE